MADHEAFHRTFQPKPENELARRIAAEKARADASMAFKFANLQMPEDIRSRAKSWGMEAFCTVLWNNAFQAGYREALRSLGEVEGGK